MGTALSRPSHRFPNKAGMGTRAAGSREADVCRRWRSGIRVITGCDWGRSSARTTARKAARKKDEGARSAAIVGCRVVVYRIFRRQVILFPMSCELHMPTRKARSRQRPLHTPRLLLSDTFSISHPPPLRRYTPPIEQLTVTRLTKLIFFSFIDRKEIPRRC